MKRSSFTRKCKSRSFRLLFVLLLMACAVFAGGISAYASSATETNDSSDIFSLEKKEPKELDQYPDDVYGVDADFISDDEENTNTPFLLSEQHLNLDFSVMPEDMTDEQREAIYEVVQTYYNLTEDQLNYLSPATELKAMLVSDFVSDSAKELLAKAEADIQQRIASAISIKKASVKLAYSSKTYSGKVLKPAVMVTYNKVKLIEGEEYKVSYKNNSAPRFLLRGRSFQTSTFCP